MSAPVKSRPLQGRDFLDLADLNPEELREVLELAHAIKKGRWAERPLEGRHIAMLFQKPSHRTRVSFEVGIARLGGTTTTLTEQDVQLGVRESVSDAAHVLDQYVDGTVARLRTHHDLLELSTASGKPVINGLTERSHPCQVLADLMTLEEAGGDLSRQNLVYIGDGNNVVTSLMEASALTGLGLTVISPPGYQPAAAVLDRARSIEGGIDRIKLTSDIAAVDGASAIYDEVIDGPRSVVFQQAGNRLYAQMALMAMLFGGDA